MAAFLTVFLCVLVFCVFGQIFRHIMYTKPAESDHHPHTAAPQKEHGPKAVAGSAVKQH